MQCKDFIRDTVTVVITLPKIEKKCLVLEDEELWSGNGGGRFYEKTVHEEWLR